LERDCCQQGDRQRKVNEEQDPPERLDRYHIEYDVHGVSFQQISAHQLRGFTCELDNDRSRLGSPSETQFLPIDLAPFSTGLLFCRLVSPLARTNDTKPSTPCRKPSGLIESSWRIRSCRCSMGAIDQHEFRSPGHPS